MPSERKRIERVDDFLKALFFSSVLSVNRRGSGSLNVYAFSAEQKRVILRILKKSFAFPSHQIVVSNGRALRWENPWGKSREKMRWKHFEILDGSIKPKHSKQISINAKKAFGDSRHVTTRLALKAMNWMANQREIAGRRFTDIGCGSGILVIVAKKLGATSAIGTEIDLAAVREAKANALRNKAKVIIRKTKEVPRGKRDVFSCNMLFPSNLEMLPAIEKKLVPGGWLILTGYTEAQKTLADAAFAAYGFKLRKKFGEKKWIVALLQKLND